MAMGKMTLPYSKTYKAPKKNKKAKKAKSKLGKLQKQLNALNDKVPKAEVKTVDINSFSTAVSSTAGANHPMVQIAQGNSAAQRDGDAIQLRSSTLNITLNKGDSSNIIRLIMAVTPSDSNLVLSDVLQYANLTSHGNLPFSSPLKTQPTTAEKTYEILFDKVYNLTEEVQTIVDRVKIDYGKKGKRLNFNATGSVAPENFNVSLMYISDSTASGHPTISYCFRSKFQDI